MPPNAQGHETRARRAQDEVVSTPDHAESGSSAAFKFCPECGARYDADVAFCARDGSALATPRVAGLVGHVLAGRYRVIEQLGQGAMGHVYLAEHIKMGRRCAVKVMSPELMSDADAIGRFNREATSASRIQHPHVAAVYDFGESSDGLVFLAMEFVPGEALSRICERERVLPPERAVNIARQVADGLDAAHEMGIVHRDLKPDNIMIARGKDGGDVVKIVDFGIAKGTRHGATTSQQLTRTGVVVGTLQYMSPEQLGGDPIDGRSDLYALACILYEMLTGESSFTGPTIEARLQRRLAGEPLRPRDANAEVPAWLEALVVKALAREPEARFQTAAALRDALALGGGAPAPASPKARRLWFSAGALAGAATLAVLGMNWHRAGGDEQRVGPVVAAAPSPPPNETAPPASPVVQRTPDAPASSGSPSGAAVPVRRGADSAAAMTQLELMRGQRDALAARQSAVDSGAPAASVRHGDLLMHAADSAITRRRYDAAMRAMRDAQETWQAAAESAIVARAALRAAASSGAPATPSASSAPPPMPAPPHPATVAPVDPTPGIQAAITSYAQALSSRDIDQVRAAYPALTADEARRWQDIFDATNSIGATLTLAAPPHLGATGSADVDVTATFDFDYKRGVEGDRHPTLKYHAVLVRDGQQWKLTSIK